jgi:hypothetical protein
MAKNVYYQGKLIPAKDWDYDAKRPKIKKKEPIEVVAELPSEVADSPEE